MLLAAAGQYGMVSIDNQPSLDLVVRRRRDILAVDSKSGNKSDGRIDPFTHGNPS
jgi:hypothetical protein